MLLEILVAHLEKACGLNQPPVKQEDKKSSSPSSTERNGGLSKPLEDINTDEIFQLLKLLQEVMRMSSDTQKALVQHQMASQ
jgi:hypothetical protein